MKRWMFGILALGFAFPLPACAGAWVQPEGQLQIIRNFTFYSTGEAFDGKGRRADNPGFRKGEFNPYAEYGASEDWTLGTSLFFQYLEQDNAEGGALSNRGLGEMEWFARYQLLQEGGYALSIQPLVNLPGHYFDKNGPIAGREDWDAELALLGGYGFSWRGRDHYIDAKAAYRYRSGALADQYRLSAAAGFALDDAWQVVPELHFTGRANGTNKTLSLGGQNDYELLKAQLSFVWRFNEVYSLQFGGFRHVEGKDTGAGGGVMVALWTQW